MNIVNYDGINYVCMPLHTKFVEVFHELLLPKLIIKDQLPIVLEFKGDIYSSISYDMFDISYIIKDCRYEEVTDNYDADVINNSKVIKISEVRRDFYKLEDRVINRSIFYDTELHRFVLFTNNKYFEENRYIEFILLHKGLVDKIILDKKALKIIDYTDEECVKWSSRK